MKKAYGYSVILFCAFLLAIYAFYHLNYFKLKFSELRHAALVHKIIESSVVGSDYLSSVSNYGAADLESTTKKLSIIGNGAPSGIYFKYKLSSEKEYVLYFKGKNTVSTASLRINDHVNNLQYIYAPNSKVLKLFICNKKDFELLLYSDKRFQYDLESVKVELCTKNNMDCRTHKLMKSGLVNSKVISSPYLISTALYGNPDLKLQKKKIILKSVETPSGLYLNYNLSPTKNYALEINGISQAGSATLRVKQDEKEIRYMLLPKSGQLKVYIKGTKKLELLVYSDHNFNYAVSHINLHSCVDCDLDLKLKKLILRDLPQLEQALKNNKMKAIAMLLDWSANHILFGLSPKVSKPMNGLSPGNIYFNYFLPRRSGVFCGGASVFFSGILHLFNIDAFTVDMGYKDDAILLSHVSVIAAIKSHIDNTYNYYIFDPTFNITFKLPHSGSYAPLNYMKNSLAKATFLDDVDTVSGKLSDRKYLIEKNKTCSYYNLSQFKFNPLPNSTRLCQLKENYFNHFMLYFREQLTKIGYHLDNSLIVQLLSTRVFFVGETLNKSSRRDFIALFKSEDQ